MNFAITYTTKYRYDAVVIDEHDVLRISPTSTPNQRVHASDVTVDPQARLFRHRDYFGTEVIELNIAESHDELEVIAESRVVTYPPPPPPTGGFDALGSDGYRRDGGEFLLPWSQVEEEASLEELIATIRRDSPRETLEALCEVIPERFEYRPGVTYVGSTVDDFLRGGAGVCQDFVHLALAMLRRLGIAGRYVSGYFFAPSDEGNASAEVDTHAWLEALLPDGERGPMWVGADPTNRRLAGPEHVKIGHGRNYSDVPPLKGVYNGDARADHEVQVRMVDLDR